MKAITNKIHGASDYLVVMRLLLECGIKYRAFFLPLFLSVLAALLEGFSMSLLAPTLDFAVQGAVDAKKESWLVSNLQDFLSSLYVHDPKAILVLLVSAIFVSEALKYYLTFLSSVQIARLVHKFCSNVRIKLFSNYLSFGKLYFDSNSRGEMYQIITTNTKIVGNSLRSVHSALFQLTTLAVYLVMMLVISWRLTVIAMLVFPALHYLAEGLISKVKKTSHTMSISNSTLGRKISNALASIPLVKIYGTEEKEKKDFIEVSRKIESSESEIDRLILMLEPLRDSVVLVCISLLVVFIWLISKASNSVGVGKYLVFILLLKRSARFFGALNSTRAAVAEIFGPLEQIEEVINSKQNVYAVASGDNVFKKLETNIEIKSLNFSYPDKSSSLHDLKLTIPINKTLAIVGRSGAGKTTLINILARFYDCPENTIFVNNKDLRSYSIKSWSRKIAMVSQDSFLFYASLRENLTYGLQDISDELLSEVLLRAGMLDFVSKLPQGLDTVIGDGGIKLSGGEKQRISLARAFLRDPEIIILDEPTSALDSQTEKEIQNEIQELCANKTVIVIAHRLSTVRHADWIVVMEAGQIVEQGALADLTSKEGKFKKYWDSQQLPS